MVILIYRGLILGIYFLRSVLREIIDVGTGDYNEVVIPVPIPNTEVKHFRGENTLNGEDSSLPVLFVFLSSLFVDDQ